MEKIVYFFFLGAICLSICGIVTMAVSPTNDNVTPINETLNIEPLVNESKPIVEPPIQNETLTPLEEFNESYELIPLEEQEYIEEELPEEEIIQDDPIEEPEIIETPAPIEEKKPVINPQTTAPVQAKTTPETTKSTTKPVQQKTVTPSIVCKQISEGSLSFTAPQIYYEVALNEKGELKMGEQFKNRKFILVPVN